MERRLAAILAADVVGYSRLMGADEAGTLAALRQMRQQIFEPTVRKHRGTIVKRMGDGWLVEFASAGDAVTCAIQLQQSLAADETMTLRVGVHIGDVAHEEEDIYGDGVNTAARLQEASAPGGIVISDMARRSIDGKLAAAFAALGARQLKNIAEPVTVFGWGVASEPSGSASAEAAGQLPDKPSIVVLPFANMSQDPEQEYFSDGIAEDIITDLSKLSGMFVIARNSAFVYKNKVAHVPDVCSELGVRFALEGSVRRAGNRVRVTAQLIDGASGGHLWAERYDRDLNDIFQVQDDVTQQIVGALKITLSDAEKARIVDGGTRNADAHDVFLKARTQLLGLKRDRDMFAQVTGLFRHAIALDPDYADPYAGLGLAYVLDHQNRWSDAPETSIEQAQHFVDTARAKDSRNWFAHYVTSVVAMFKKDYRR